MCVLFVSAGNMIRTPSCFSQYCMLCMTLVSASSSQYLAKRSLMYQVCFYPAYFCHILLSKLHLLQIVLHLLTVLSLNSIPQG